jgi:hypothetical protein
MSHAVSLPRTLRARRMATCPAPMYAMSASSFAVSHASRNAILPDNERKTDARQEQEAVNHVRGDPQPAAGRFQAADAAPGPQREQQRT